jgi:histidyl-tRNA synthetase
LKNPTRILDDKVDGEKEFVKKAPKISAFLSQEEIEEFNQLQNLLKSFNINYVINENLVRGLDYYTNTIFEILDKDGVALGGGGRYSKLVGEFGGEDVQCTGMAFGIDRIIGYLTENNINSGIDSNINIDILFVCLVNSMDAQVKILSYMDECRKQNLSCTCNFKITKLDKSFNYAEKLNAQYVFIIGNNELETNTITCKNINTKEQVNDNLSNLLKNIKK